MPPIENAEYISQFDLSQPNGAIDTVDMLDDFLRGIKKAVQQSFPNVDSPVLLSTAEMNNFKTHMSRGDNTWDMKDSFVTNVRAIDQDNAVQPRSYNDGRYLLKSANLSDIPNKQAALNELLTGFSSGSPAYQQMRRLVADIMLPVGTIYTNYVHGSNPHDFFGVGVWQPYAQGRVVIGHGSTTDTRGESRAFNNGQSGGAFQHALSVAEMPNHSHGIPIASGEKGWSAAEQGNHDAGYGAQTTGAGGDAAHNNVQPYITCYVWVRTG